MQSNTNKPITEDELAELETSCARSVNSERVPDRWLLALKLASEVPRLIAEVRRLRAEMPTAIAQLKPGERQTVTALGEYTRIYIKHVPPPPPSETDKLEAEILAGWAREEE